MPTITRRCTSSARSTPRKDELGPQLPHLQPNHNMSLALSFCRQHYVAPHVPRALSHLHARILHAPGMYWSTFCVCVLCANLIVHGVTHVPTLRACTQRWERTLWASRCSTATHLRDTGLWRLFPTLTCFLRVCSVPSWTTSCLAASTRRD
jgi:hypothetical protein